MTASIALTELSYVLRREPFRETSALVRVWCKSVGLQSAIVKGVYGSKQIAQTRNAWLQPFSPLLMQLRGLRELKTIYDFEPAGPAWRPTGALLPACLYLNQLSFITLTKFQVDEALFVRYQLTLKALARAQVLEQRLSACLREYEQFLLEHIGFGINFETDNEAQPIQAKQTYRYTPEFGFCLESTSSLTGEQVSHLKFANWGLPGTLSWARQIYQAQLQWCLEQELPRPMRLTPSAPH